MGGRWKRRAAAVAAAVAVAASSPPAGAQERTISIRDFYFATKFLVVTVGERVRWVHEGTVKHTVTTFPGAPAGGFDSSPNADTDNDATFCNGNVVTPDDCIEPGEDFTSPPLDTPGTYNYFCKPHRSADVPPDPSKDAQAQPCGMCAQLVVKEKASSPPPATRRSSPKATRRTSPTATVSAPATPAGSPGETPSEVTTPVGTGSPLATGRGTGDESGGASRIGLALLAIIALGGAGYATWRRFLAAR